MKLKGLGAEADHGNSIEDLGSSAESHRKPGMEAILQRASSHFKKGNVEIEMLMVSASDGSGLNLGLVAFRE